MPSDSSSPAIPRKGFVEIMQMSRLPDDTETTKGSVIKRFVSHQPAWVPGSELPWAKLGLVAQPFNRSFGGHVYIQSPLAAARVVEDEARSSNDSSKGKFGIHSIQGVFTNAGHSDRPFVYQVTDIASTRSFSTHLVTARQPTQPSSQPTGPYPASDADLPLGDVCFTCITTFRRPVPSFAEEQVQSAQERYADILKQKAGDEWEASPQADIDRIKDLFPNAGHGGFPILDMYKVDMTSYNANKPVVERRELILYRLHKPIPVEDANAHILCHAFEADRNGLIMLGNHLGWGYNNGPVASLSYAFYVHTNADEAVFRNDGWWIQEVYWPRVSAGRGTLESRIWSPEGKHVASGYQDGICLPKERNGKL
ncbi:hypothetical protein PT974_04869 [Cladobotryum mycophilum]|uniref:Acyl-CoA thioesterase-like C-terminal domain-containing protein n=1 Tax=Cladobotryum mycophilum TaxID=491253 RepID=A0ABR0SRN9_9HYPO